MLVAVLGIFSVFGVNIKCFKGFGCVGWFLVYIGCFLASLECVISVKAGSLIIVSRDAEY